MTTSISTLILLSWRNADEIRLTARERTFANAARDNASWSMGAGTSTVIFSPHVDEEVLGRFAFVKPDNHVVFGGMEGSTDGRSWHRGAERASDGHTPSPTKTSLELCGQRTNGERPAMIGPMEILVTGGLGFIGSALPRRSLVRLDARASTLDDRSGITSEFVDIDERLPPISISADVARHI